MFMDKRKAIKLRQKPARINRNVERGAWSVGRNSKETERNSKPQNIRTD
jgi:hypothetical protein